MAYAVEDFEDMMLLLGQHPEWQARLRDLLVGDQLERINTSIERLEQAIEAQGRQIEAQGRQIEELGLRIEEQGRQFRQALDSLIATINSRFGRLEGSDIERRLRNNGRSLLWEVLKRAEPVHAPDLELVEEALASGAITRGEMADLVRVDIVFRGKLASGTDALLAVEASKTIGMTDLDRVQRRAQVLRRAGYETIPMVAGEIIREEDRARAVEQGVALMLGGLVENWPR